MSYLLEALEMRLRWLKWSQTEHAQKVHKNDLNALSMYKHSLEYGDTYLMNAHFCNLVDQARRIIPNELKFDPAWMLTDAGWMWLEKPFTAPKLNDPKAKGQEFKISAIAWFKIPIGIPTEYKLGETGRVSIADTYEFIVFHDLTTVDKITIPTGFGCWSYFTLQPNDLVLDRIRRFEVRAAQHRDGAYIEGSELDQLHEIRWIYAAMHLMSQKLTVTYQQKADRNTRRRLEREPVKVEPWYRIVTLRRLEQEQRKHPEESKTVDWQYQWLVKIHGRWQYYPKEETHKYIIIDTYIKGPPDKPLKSPSTTIFVARR